MAEIVFAAGVPHAPGLIGLLDAAPVDVQDFVHGMYADLRTKLLASRPDVLIVFGNDHLANSRPRAYPDFLIGMAPVHSGPYEWYREWLGCRDYRIKGGPAVAEALFRGMSRRGHRMHAQRENLRYDDNLSIPSLHLRLDETDIAVVPVLQNCTVPPLPDTRQCYALGRSLADLVAHDLPAGLRVALLGSGGLSHEPGGSRYWYIDKDFDLWFMELMASGDHEKLLRDLTVARMEQAGSVRATARSRPMRCTPTSNAGSEQSPGTWSRASTFPGPCAIPDPSPPNPRCSANWIPASPRTTWSRT